MGPLKEQAGLIMFRIIRYAQDHDAVGQPENSSSSERNAVLAQHLPEMDPPCFLAGSNLSIKLDRVWRLLDTDSLRIDLLNWGGSFSPAQLLAPSENSWRKLFQASLL